MICAVAFLSCSEPNPDLREDLPETVNYEQHIKSILDHSCVRCHGGVVTHGINFSSYANILESVGTDPSEDIIVIGNPQSKLLRSRINPEDGAMYEYLSDHSDYEKIYLWIVVDSLRQY